MEREALKLALEALEEAHYKVEHKQDAAKREQAITAIKAALAQPPQREWVGLTPENILALFDEHNLYGSKLVEFARAVEAKLKEKNT